MYKFSNIRQPTKFFFVAVFATFFILAGAFSGSAQEFDSSIQRTEDIRQAQEHLAALGFDPGPIDGLPGEKTVMALREFQQTAGLPESGILTVETLTALNDIVGRNENSTSSVTTDRNLSNDMAPAEGLQLPVLDPRRLAGTVWHFTDSTGAQLKLMFDIDGGIGNVLTPDSWSWRTREETIIIEYRNPLGRTATRTGRFESQADLRMHGTGTSNHSEGWTWSASRVR